MALQYGGAVPSTGLGNIGITPGAPGSPGALPPRPVMGPMMRPQPVQPPSQPPSIGNIQMAAPQQGAMAPQQGARGSITQIMSQLHPQALQALKGIPPQALQALHAAGLIHPQLMQHLHGGVSAPSRGAEQY